MQRDAPLELLNAAWEQTLGFKAIGFKLNLGQSPEVFEEVLNNSAVMKIVISRKNRLRTFVSEKIANTSGQWESYADSDWESTPKAVNVTLEELESNVSRNREYYQNIRLRLRNSGQTGLELDYESLGSERVQAGILRYLGVDPAVALKEATSRMNKAPLESIISNYAQLQSDLSGHELEQDTL